MDAQGMDSQGMNAQGKNSAGTGATAAAGAGSGAANGSASAVSAAGSGKVSARYGSQNGRGSAFTGKILAVVLAALMIAAVVYMVSMFRNQSAVDVSAVETGGEIVSDSLLVASVDITRDDPSKAAYCVIYALDYEKNEVGRREIAVPAGGEKTIRYEVHMPTRERAHAAKVYGCSSVVPPHLHG